MTRHLISRSPDSYDKGTKKKELAEFFVNHALSDDIMTNFLKANSVSVANRYAKVPDEIKDIILDSEKKWESITPLDWNFILPQWDKLDERWKKEVLPVVQ